MEFCFYFSQSVSNGQLLLTKTLLSVLEMQPFCNWNLMANAMVKWGDIKVSEHAQCVICNTVHCGVVEVPYKANST